MQIPPFLDALDRPLKIAFAVLASVTFLARIPAVQAWPGRRYLGQFDLWTEGSLAALASGGFFLLAGLSFVAIGWGGAVAPRLRDRFVDRWVLRGAALGFVFFAFDEVFQIHEALGARLAGSGAASGANLDEGVFSWVLIYAPVVMGAAAALCLALGRLYREAPRREVLKRAPWLMAVLVVGPASLIAFELIESQGWTPGDVTSPLGAIEETMELLILLVIIRLNVGIAKGYEA